MAMKIENLRKSVALSGLAWVVLAATNLAAAAPENQVVIEDLGSKLKIQIGGELFTEYYYKDVPRPYLYPIIGPKGLPMTRNWPMKEVEGEERDHPHHKSLWFTHGAVNGVDFWSDGAAKGKIVHEKFTQISSGNQGTIKAFHKWTTAEGKLVLTEDRTVQIAAEGPNRIIDFEIALHASEGAVTLGDTKEGSMAIRLAETMRLKAPKNKPGKGHIVNSEGLTDDATWGKRAKWCDYYGPVEGQSLGVAMFDHPANPRYPTWWHVRDYGLFAANPFGIHDFEKAPANQGDLKIEAGQSLTFRYRFVFHAGSEKEAGIAGLYLNYINQK
jgi:hypothetical protein